MTADICAAGPIPSDYDVLTMGCPRPTMNQVEGWILLFLLIAGAISLAAALDNQAREEDQN